MTATEKQQLLHMLTSSHRKTVKSVMHRNGPDAEAIMRLASDGQAMWTLPEWDRLLATLDGCEQTVKEWSEGLWIQS